MSELSPEIITIVMLGGLFVGILIGYPVGIIVGGMGLIVGWLILGPPTLGIIYNRFYSILLSYTFLAVPLFTFMGILLQHSGIAGALYDTLHMLFGRFRGGLAISTVLLGTILAACLGVITASVATLTLFALPPMINRGYDKSLASGAVCAGGCLGILIPPSVMLVIYGPMAQISVGKLFMGAIFPGILLAILYCIYIAVRCRFQPEIAPSISPEETKISITKKIRMLLTSLVPPVVLIMSVLGSIFFGVAPPTEAAAVGAFGALVLTLAYRKFNWQMLKGATLETFRVTGFVMLIGTMAAAFVGVFLSAGCGEVVQNLILRAPGGNWGAFATVMFIVFILGFFINWLAIVFIIVPIVSPIVLILGFDPVWFAIMVCVNLQMCFMTPPMATSIYICHGTSPPELGLTIGHIIRGVAPFVVLIIIGLGICIAFPDLILWLPSRMITRW